MKRLKLDLSKEGMRRFWLRHAEKVVLVVAVVLLGLFVYLGYRTPFYSKKTPTEMSNLASQASTYIQSSDSWNQIQNYRLADSTAHQRIERSKGFDVASSDYKWNEDIVGPPVKTLGLRSDPELRPVEELIARSATVSILMTERNDKLRMLDSAMPVAVVADPGKKDKDKDDEKKAPKEDPNAPGISLSELQKTEMVGVRTGTTFKASGMVAPFVTDIVAVTGLIPYENQFNEYKRVFESSLGYFPDRDRPIYTKIQIQRKIEDGEWTDITKQIFSDAQKLAAASGATVPDVIDPRYYYKDLKSLDPITGDIPPIVQNDYRHLASHPKVPSREFVPSFVKEEFSLTEQQTADVKSPFERTEKPKSDAEIQQEKQRRQTDEVNRMKGTERAEYDKYGKRVLPVVPYKLVRFFDLTPPVGKRVQYRVRLWMPDVNNPDLLKEKVATSDPSGKKRDDPRAQQGGGSGIDGGGAPGGGGVDGGGQGSQESTEDEKDKDWDMSKFTFVAVLSHMLDMPVRERLKTKLDETEFVGIPEDERELYEYLIPTPWSDATAPVLVGGNDYEFFAGQMIPPTELRVGGVEVPKTEPKMTIVASTLSKDIHTIVPGLKIVSRGDVVNFKVDKAHVLDPVDNSVRVYRDAEIETDAVVVDLMGGSNLPIKGTKVEFASPGEALVMDASGNFHLHNDAADAKGYRHRMFKDDESAEYGRKKTEKDEKDDRRGGGGGDDQGR